MRRMLLSLLGVLYYIGLTAVAGDYLHDAPSQHTVSSAPLGETYNTAPQNFYGYPAQGTPGFQGFPTPYQPLPPIGYQRREVNRNGETILTSEPSNPRLQNPLNIPGLDTVGSGFNLITGEYTQSLFNWMLPADDGLNQPNFNAAFYQQFKVPFGIQVNSLPIGVQKTSREIRHYDDFLALKAKDVGFTVPPSHFGGFFSMSQDAIEMEHMLKHHDVYETLHTYKLYELVLTPPIDDICTYLDGERHCCEVARGDLFSNEYKKAVNALPTENTGIQSVNQTDDKTEDSVFNWDSPTEDMLFVRKFITLFGTHYVRRATFGGQIRMVAKMRKDADGLNNLGEDANTVRTVHELMELELTKFIDQKRHASEIDVTTTNGQTNRNMRMEGATSRDDVMDRTLRYGDELRQMVEEEKEGLSPNHEDFVSNTVYDERGKQHMETIDNRPIGQRIQDEILPQLAKNLENDFDAQEKLKIFEDNAEFNIVFEGGDSSIAKNFEIEDALTQWQDSLRKDPIVLQVELRPISELVREFLDTCDPVDPIHEQLVRDEVQSGIYGDPNKLLSFDRQATNQAMEEAEEELEDAIKDEASSTIGDKRDPDDIFAGASDDEPDKLVAPAEEVEEGEKTKDEVNDEDVVTADEEYEAEDDAPSNLKEETKGSFIETKAKKHKHKSHKHKHDHAQVEFREPSFVEEEQRLSSQRHQIASAALFSHANAIAGEAKLGRFHSYSRSHQIPISRNHGRRGHIRHLNSIDELDSYNSVFLQVERAHIADRVHTHHNKQHNQAKKHKKSNKNSAGTSLLEDAAHRTHETRQVSSTHGKSKQSWFNFLPPKVAPYLGIQMWPHKELTTELGSLHDVNEKYHNQAGNNRLMKDGKPVFGNITGDIPCWEDRVCPPNPEQYVTRQRNVEFQIRQVLRIGALVRQQRDLLAAYKFDYERPNERKVKIKKCKVYEEAVARYRVYYIWATGADVPDVEAVNCLDLQSEEVLHRRAQAVVSEDAASVCKFCVRLYETFQRYLQEGSTEFYHEVIHNRHTRETVLNHPMFLEQEERNRLLKQGKCNLRMDATMGMMQSNALFAYRRLPEYIAVFSNPTQVCEGSNTADEYQMENEQCVVLLDSYFRSPPCYDYKDTGKESTPMDWKVNEIALMRRKLYQAYLYGCQTGDDLYNKDHGQCPPLFACHYAGFCHASDYEFPLEHPPQGLFRYNVPLLTYNGQTPIAAPMPQDAGLYSKHHAACPREVPKRPAKWIGGGDNSYSRRASTSALDYNEHDRLSTLHNTDDVDVEEVAGVHIHLGDMVTRVGWFPAWTTKLSQLFGDIQSQNSKSFDNEANDHGFTIMFEEVEDTSSFVCHVYHFDTLTFADYIHWRDWMCMTMLKNPSPISGDCADFGANGKWFTAGQLSGPPYVFK